MKPIILLDIDGVLNRADAGDADWDSVVWVDDVLGPDAWEWARTHHQPVLLEKPDPHHGLQELHVARAEAFTAGSPDTPPARSDRSFARVTAS